MKSCNICVSKFIPSTVSQSRIRSHCLSKTVFEKLVADVLLTSCILRVCTKQKSVHQRLILIVSYFALFCWFANSVIATVANVLARAHESHQTSYGFICQHFANCLQHTPVETASHKWNRLLFFFCNSRAQECQICCVTKRLGFCFT